MFFMRSIINATVLHLQLLQILLQPALAPQLHACFDHCHAFEKAHATAHGCCGKEDCGGSKKSPNSDSHSHHNCTSCPICDVLTAPRVPAVICSLQLVTLLTRLDPAATLPVFALPAILQPQPEIHVRADEETRYEFVGRVVATCQRAAIMKIGFITEPPPRGGG